MDFKHYENIGPNYYFNFCDKQARGDYFLLLHDDDLIDRDFIELCIGSVEQIESPGIIRTGTRLIDDGGNVIKEKQNQVVGLAMEDFLLGWFDGKTSLYLCSTIFNTKKLKEIGGFSSRKNLFQDVVAEVKLASNYGRIDVADVKASFRKHSGESTFGVNVRDWCEDSLYLLDVLSKLQLDKKEEVLKKGKKFLWSLNYNRASAVTSIVGRFKAYMVVYRIVGFDFDVFCGILLQRFRNIKRSIKNRVKQVVFGG